MARDTIKKIEFIDREVDFTYNIQVDTNRNYFADGILVHNCDDPINPRQAASDVERENANTFVTSTLSSRKIDKAITPTILIMQRLHEKDPTGAMLSRGGNIKHINLPAEESDTIKPIELREKYVNGLMDPIRLNRKSLDDARRDLGSYGYAGQFMQNPAPAEGGLIKKSWFDIIDWIPEYENLTWNFTADTAYTSNEKNDPSGYLSYAEKDNDYIIRFAQTDYLEFPELCKMIVSFAHLHGYTNRSIIEVEPKASGKSLVQTLRKETNLNIKEGVPPAKDKIARVKDVSPIIESRRVKLIKGSWNDKFLDEVSMFPNAENDELVDCLTMMLNRKKQVNYGTRRKRPRPVSNFGR